MDCLPILNKCFSSSAYSSVHSSVLGVAHLGALGNLPCVTERMREGKLSSEGQGVYMTGSVFYIITRHSD